MNVKDLMPMLTKNIFGDKYPTEFTSFPNGCGLIIGKEPKAVTMAVSDVEIIGYRESICEHLTAKIKTAVHSLEAQ